MLLIFQISHAQSKRLSSIERFLANTKDLSADVRSLLEGYYSSRGGLTGEVKSQISDICIWLEKKQSSLIAELRMELSSGRFQVKSHYEQFPLASIGCFLGSRYLFYKSGCGPMDIKFPTTILGSVALKGNAAYIPPSGSESQAQVIIGNLKFKSNAELFILLFNGSIHEHAHGFRYSVGGDGIVSELGTYLAQSSYALPLYSNTNYPAFGKRYVPNTVAQFSNGNIDKENFWKFLKYFGYEYFAFLIGPYVEAYYKNKGTPIKFYDFYVMKPGGEDFGIHDKELENELFRAFKEWLRVSFKTFGVDFDLSVLAKILEKHLGKPSKKDIPPGFVRIDWPKTEFFA